MDNSSRIFRNGRNFRRWSKREAKEEANLEIKLMKLYGTYSIPRISQIYIIYLGKILNDDYFGNSETSEVRIFNVKDIPWSDIAFSSVKFLLEKYKYDLNNKKQFGFTRIINSDIFLISINLIGQKWIFQ